MKDCWKTIKIISCCVLFFCVVTTPGLVSAQDTATVQKKLTLSEATMCEEIKEYAPQNPAVVFSMAIGRVFCFTAFSFVPSNMYIYHSWYRRDRLITTKRLSLKTPEWSTFSTIQLREADKGPWRVEIKDNKNKILEVLRFSITD